MSPIVLPTLLTLSFTLGLVTVLVTTLGGLLFPPPPPGLSTGDVPVF